MSYLAFMLTVVCFPHVQLYRVAHLHQSPAAALISMVLVAHTLLKHTHSRTLARSLAPAAFSLSQGLSITQNAAFSPSSSSLKKCLCLLHITSRHLYQCPIKSQLNHASPFGGPSFFIRSGFTALCSPSACAGRFLSAVSDFQRCLYLRYSSQSFFLRPVWVAVVPPDSEKQQKGLRCSSCGVCICVCISVALMRLICGRSAFCMSDLSWMVHNSD